MSHTLLLRLVAPMQSWGVQSDFTHRDTGLEPSKSGVIGLLCAALGRGREQPLDDLAALRMGVRVDREGVMQCDYHTAKDVLKAKGKAFKASDLKDTELSWRYYLADAAFLVGLEGEDLTLLRHLHDALHRPRWFLFLGRKAFVPGEPVWLRDGLREGESLEQALRSYRPRLRAPRRGDDARMRLVIEVRAGERGEITRRDQPVSFARGRRQFITREMTVTFCDPPGQEV